MTTIKKNKYVIVALVIIMLAAAVMRFWSLESAPPGFYTDEAINANEAISVLESGEYSVFYSDNYGREGLFVNLVSVSFAIFGIGIWQIRAVAAVAGLLTVLGMYFFSRELVGKQPALFTTALLAVSFWHVVFSRVGFRAALMPTFLVWGMFLLLRAVRKQQWSGYVVSGILFGLGMYTYIPFRIAVLLPALVLLLEIYKYIKKGGLNLFIKRFLTEGLIWRWLSGFAAMFFTSLPLIIYFLKNPIDFIYRTEAVSVFSQANPTAAFVGNVVDALGMLHIKGDHIWRHNIANEPMLLWPVGILFIIGLAVLLVKWQKRGMSADSKILLLAWYVIMLLPAVLSFDHSPHSLRSLGILPVVYLVCGIGAAEAMNILTTIAKRFTSAEVAKKLSLTAAVLVVAMIGITQFNKYFNVWATDQSTEFSFIKHHVELAEKLCEAGESANGYMIVDVEGMMVNGMPSSIHTLSFLTRDCSNVHYLSEAEFSEIEAEITEDDLVEYMKNYEEENIPEGWVF